MDFRDALLNGLMMMYVASTHLDFSWIFFDWLDPYMKFNMQMHVALSSSYFMVLV
jgi:hypothetical protein